MIRYNTEAPFAEAQRAIILFLSILSINFAMHLIIVILALLIIVLTSYVMATTISRLQIETNTLFIIPTSMQA